MKILHQIIKEAINEATALLGMLGYSPFVLPDVRQKYNVLQDGAKHEFFTTPRGEQLLTRFEIMVLQHHLINVEIFFLALLINAINENQLTINHFNAISWFDRKDKTSSGYFILSQLISEGLLEPKDHLQNNELY